MRKEQELEEAYKKIKEQETPDLWSRIEAGIDAEERVESGSRNENRVKIKKWTIPKKQIRIIVTVAAGIVILIISVPLVSKRMDFYQHSVNGVQEVSPKPTKEEGIIGGDGNEEEIEMDDSLAYDMAESDVDSLDSNEMPQDKEELENSESLQDDKKENSEKSIDDIETNHIKGNDKANILNTAQDNEDSEEVESADNGTDDIVPNDSMESDNASLSSEETPDKATVQSDKSSSITVIHLEKASGIKVSSLEKIKASVLSENVQEKLKELVEDYSTCKFYKDQKGKVYVQDNGTLYLVKGVMV